MGDHEVKNIPIFHEGTLPSPKFYPQDSHKEAIKAKL